MTNKGKWDLIAGLRYDNIKLDAHPSTEWFNSGSTYLTDQEGTVGQPHDIEDDNIQRQNLTKEEINTINRQLDGLE